MHTVIRRIRRAGLRVGLQGEWYMYLLAACIGMLMGVVATLFLEPLRASEIFQSELSHTLLWMVVLLGPTIGGLLVGLARSAINAPYIGPGVTTVIYGVLRRRGQLRAKVGLQKWICSTLTIGSGGSAGAEGPIVTIGSVLGSTIGKWLGLNTQNMTTLLGCGAAAGIAAVFNAPIAGVLFVMEILLRDFSLRTFTPIVIAAVVASASIQGILHDSAIFQLGADFMIMEGEFRMMYMPAYVLLGLLCALVGVLFIRGLDTASHAFERIPTPVWARPALGGAALAVLGLLWLLLAGTEVPGFYGNGYPEITRLLSPSHYEGFAAGDGSGLLVLTLLALLACKLIGTCLTIGSGGAGGMFAPSLMMGAIVGGLFGLGLESLGFLEHGTPARFALVGMAAMVASVTHAPLTGILIVYELTRHYQIIMPLMLAAVVATIVARWLCRDSIYSARLREAGIRLGGAGDLTILSRLTVQDLILDPPNIVRTHDAAATLIAQAEEEGAADFIVLDDKGVYAGMVTDQDLRAALVYREAIPLLQVSELTRIDLPFVTPDETLDVVLEKFSRSDVDALPVLVDGDARRANGLVTRTRLMKRYQAALDHDHD
ncbi:MAG: chloride channel protein [Phycisphaerales bacterium]|nr:chloride channel protein [Phycisphaerales bacterium]